LAVAPQVGLIPLVETAGILPFNARGARADKIHDPITK
jgi:hypothetical protein